MHPPYGDKHQQASLARSPLRCVKGDALWGSFMMRGVGRVRVRPLEVGKPSEQGREAEQAGRVPAGVPQAQQPVQALRPEMLRW